MNEPMEDYHPGTSWGDIIIRLTERIELHHQSLDNICEILENVLDRLDEIEENKND